MTSRTHRRLWVAHALRMGLLLGLLLVVAAPAVAAPHPAALEFHDAVRRRLDGTAQPLAISDPLRDCLSHVYATWGGPPIWAGTSRMAELLARLRDAAADGLEPSDYPVADLERLSRTGAGDPLPLRVDAEIAFSAAFLMFAFDLKTGRPALAPNDVAPAVVPTPAAARLLLDGLLREGSVAGALERWRPLDAAYGRLKAALARYRSLASAGGWGALADGESLRPGDIDPRVEALRVRLAVDDEAPPAEDDRWRFDPSLAAAVERFQERHGLAVDGVVGPATRGALNVDVATRIRQIVVNMERWRWFPSHPGNRYLLINIAGFDLRLVEDARPVLRMATIVGTVNDPTPLLTSAINAIDLNPYWNVPRRIALAEELPKLRRDPARLDALGFEIIQDGAMVPVADIDWDGLMSGGVPFRLQQRPGPKNALGEVKFMFPNPHQVYLHDTPGRHLFRRPARAFSHGCVRVARPIDLAQAVLRDNEGWTRARIERAIDGGRSTRVSLMTPLPIHIVYLTAWVDDDGAVHFRDDVYGRDRRQIEAAARPRHVGRGPETAASTPPAQAAR